MLYHLSKEISLQEKTFTPRVPRFRLYGEDNRSKRVCVSNSIQNCIASFPYKNDLMLGLRTRPTYLSVYSVDEASFLKEEIKQPEEIVEKVADALEKQEYWLLKEFSATPTLIKIKKLKFSRLCKYTNEYSGSVTELEFEREIEKKDRVEKTIFYHSRHYKEFLKACALHGIQIQEDNITKEHMEYFGCIPSTREYAVHQLRTRFLLVFRQKNLERYSKRSNKNRRKYLTYERDDFS